MTFLPPEKTGAGFSLHFLKCLGQPHEGRFMVNHQDWRGKFLRAKVTSEEYNGYNNNKVAGVEPLQIEAPLEGPKVKEEEVPW